MLPAGREGEGTSVGRGMSSVQKVDIEANLWGPLRSGEWRGGVSRAALEWIVRPTPAFWGPEGRGRDWGLP